MAVVDSGWDWRLGECGARIRPSLAVAGVHGPVHTHVNDSQDQVGHGTACMWNVHRVAPGATLWPIRVFRDTLETSVGRVVAALSWAAAQGVDVVNLSLATLREDALVRLYSACEAASRAGVLVIASGSEAGDALYPFSFSNVLSVGVGSFVSPFDFEYRPDHLVECLAYGANHDVLWLRGEMRRGNGASFCAPTISGLAALFRERYPKSSLDDIREFLAEHSHHARRQAPAGSSPGTTPPSAPAEQPR